MTLPLKCLRCGQSTHMVDECLLPVLPDSRVLGPATSRTLEKEMDEQPDALKWADDLDACGFGPNKIAALLRTQHADIERKDALLRQALEALETHPGNYKLTKAECVAIDAVQDAITSELSK